MKCIKVVSKKGENPMLACANALLNMVKSGQIVNKAKNGDIPDIQFKEQSNQIQLRRRW